ncbi:MAG: LamG domain-containing protein [Akkermansiaceae bacterium]
MKKPTLISLLLALLFTSLVSANPTPFNQESDILIAQFDSIPDDDDIQSQAALASILAHPNYTGANYFCVSGAWGTQWNSNQFRFAGFTDYNGFIDSSTLFDLAFGPEATEEDSAEERAASRWVNAHSDESLNLGIESQERLDQLNFASDVVVEKVTPILEAGGRVWVMEAGQSDITADWLRKLHILEVPNVTTNVIVVQHSSWNHNQTTTNDRNYISSGDNNQYIRIDSGNSGGNATPNFKQNGQTNLAANYDALNTNTPLIEQNYLTPAISTDNVNERTRAIWAEATRITSEVSRYSLMTNNGEPDGNFIRTSVNSTPIRTGGLDFSDTVEAMYIFDIHEEEDGFHSIEGFWEHFVINGLTSCEESVRSEVNGVVVIEMENTDDDLGNWLNKTDPLSNAFSGEGYLEFNGNRITTGNPNSPIAYQFKINEGGIYYLHQRCARVTSGEREDVSNDCFVRVEGDFTAVSGNRNAPLVMLQRDTKFFGGNHLEFVWTPSGSRLEDETEDELGKKVPIYNFKAGETYTLVVSGRSKAFKIDRMVFRKNGLANALWQDTSIPETFTCDTSQEEPDSSGALYHNTFNDSALATNENVGGGLSTSSIAGGNWREASGSLFYDAGSDSGGNRASVYSLNGFTLNNGLELEVAYQISSLDVSGNTGNHFSFGLIANYTPSGENPFSGANDTDGYRAGFNLTNDDGIDQGFITAGASGEQTLEQVFVSEVGSHTLKLRLLPNASGGATWNYRYDDGSAVTGTIESFDFSLPYHFVVHGRDNISSKVIDYVTLRPTGLIAHWELDDATGALVNDSTGNGFHGTASNATWVQGQVGGALELADSSVTIPAETFDSIDQEVTIAFWSKGVTNTPNNSILYAENSQGNRVFNIHLPWGNLNTVFWDAGNPNYNRIQKSASAAEVEGSWSHWTFTKDASSGVMNIYRNGELWATGDGNTEPMDDIVAASFGSNTDGGSPYEGQIDDVRLYSIALEASEISALFSSFDLNGYEVWKAALGVSDDSKEGADDGIAPLLEYVLNGNPNQADPEILPKFEKTGSELLYTFTRNTSSTEFTAQYFQYSLDLTNWTEIDISTDTASEVSIVSNEDGTQEVTIKLNETSLNSQVGEGRKVFSRLKVNQ